MYSTTILKTLFCCTTALLLVSGKSTQQECGVDEGCDPLGNIGNKVGKCVRSDGTYNADCTCTGWEDRGSGGAGYREFTITCRKGTNPSLTCVYRGQPHCCPFYTNGNQQSFYDQLLNVIGPNMCQVPIGNCPQRDVGYHVPDCVNQDRSYFKYWP